MTVRLATYNLLHGMTVLGGVPQPARDEAGTVVTGHAQGRVGGFGPGILHRVGLRRAA